MANPNWRRTFALCYAAVLVLTGASSATAADAIDASPSTGRLQAFGGYLAPVQGSSVTMLDDGTILVAGHGPELHQWKKQSEQTDELRQRVEQGNITGADTVPKWYDPAHHGWRRLPNMPECDYTPRYLHTATALTDGKVLIAGGMCDAPKMGNDHAPHPPFRAMSLWDSHTHKWLPAPELTQARIYHSASLMRGGSVMITGGEIDPGLSDSHVVLASVERFADGKVTVPPPMATARAKHSATPLPNGSLLVAGGFDADGRSLASVEMYDPATGAWRALPAMQVARHSHTATLLADGRILVAGGIGINGAALASAEVFDPAQQRWNRTADLPIPLYGHGAIAVGANQVLVAGGAWLSAYGKNVPWAWTWNSASNDWDLAAQAAPLNETDMSSPMSMVARRDGSVLIFTVAGVLRWTAAQPAAPGSADIPVWQSQPAAALLRDQRLIVIGHLAGDFGNGEPAARIWSQQTDRWTEAGSIAANNWLKASALQLPSGRVLYLGIDREDNLRCAAWPGAGMTWSDCGRVNLAYAHDWRLRPGLLPDGRPYVLANQHEAFVLDEASMQWRAWPSEWNTEGLTYGAPIRGKQPLARIHDEANGKWYEVNDAGARLMQSMNGKRMLWDPQTQTWAYILVGRKMGSNAQLLPDGCAISTSPLALFNAADASIRPLSDPGFGSRPGEMEMLVMPDGTVVTVGAAVGTQDAGAGFFHAKTNCSGFVLENTAEAFISNTLAPPEANNTAAANAAPAPAPQPSRWQLASTWLGAHRWILAAVLGTILAGLLLWRAPRLRATLFVSKGGWGVRVLIYGALLAVALPNIRALLYLHKQDAVPSLDGTIPCNMVGMWSSRHGQEMRRVELKDDGTFHMSVAAVGNDPADGYHGKWAVQGENLVWLDSRFDMELDINPMKSIAPGRFTLVEGNGTHTEFELIRPVPSTHCAQ